jgi:hypothetical protein
MPLLEEVEISRSCFPYIPANDTTWYQIVELPHLRWINFAGEMDACAFIMNHLKFPPSTHIRLCLIGQGPRHFLFLVSHDFGPDHAIQISCGPKTHFFHILSSKLDLVIVSEKNMQQHSLAVLRCLNGVNPLKSLHLRLTSSCSWVELNWDIIFRYLDRLTDLTITLCQLRTEFLIRNPNLFCEHIVSRSCSFAKVEEIKHNSTWNGSS